MICSHVCRQRAMASPFHFPRSHIEGGPILGARSRRGIYSLCVQLDRSPEGRGELRLPLYSFQTAAPRGNSFSSALASRQAG